MHGIRRLYQCNKDSYGIAVVLGKSVGLKCRRNKIWLYILLGVDFVPSYGPNVYRETLNRTVDPNPADMVAVIDPT